MIGAGTVVTKNVPSYALVFGNPGKIVAWVDRKGDRLNLIQMARVCVENSKNENGVLIMIHSYINI